MDKIAEETRVDGSSEINSDDLKDAIKEIESRALQEIQERTLKEIEETIDKENLRINPSYIKDVSNKSTQRQP